MNALQRPGRAAAAVGAVVAVSATTLMALVAGTASAAEPGRCLENVNVRAEPDISAPIVVVCEAGTEVEVGETQNGFVELINLGGWSAAEFVEVDRTATPGTPGTGTDEEAGTETAPAGPRFMPAPPREEGTEPGGFGSDDTTGPGGGAGPDDTTGPGTGSGGGFGSDDATGPGSAGTDDATGPGSASPGDATGPGDDPGTTRTRPIAPADPAPTPATPPAEEAAPADPDVADPDAADPDADESGLAVLEMLIP